MTIDQLRKDKEMMLVDKANAEAIMDNKKEENSELREVNDKLRIRISDVLVQRTQQTYASMTVERDEAIGDESKPAYVNRMPIDDEERAHRRRTRRGGQNHRDARAQGNREKFEAMNVIRSTPSFSPDKKVIEDVQDELVRLQQELHVRGSTSLGMNTLISGEAPTELSEVKNQRDTAILKNNKLYVELQEANKKLTEQDHRHQSQLHAKSVTPGLPKVPANATSLSKAWASGQLGASTSTNQANDPPDDEMKKLREELVEQEARADDNYEEMRQHRSWLKNVEDGQETIKGSEPAQQQYDPVPDNPAGLWDQHEGSVAGKGLVDGQNELITRISRKEHESSHQIMAAASRS